MISNIEILFGLANRCKKYGIKNTRSYSNLACLTKFFEICDGVDGAEAYGWDPNDLKILKKYKKSINYTKIDIFQFNNDELRKLLQKHSFENNKTYLKGIYIHNKVNENIIKKYKSICSFIRDELKVKIGFSVYEQKEIDLILKHDLVCDIIQIPYNLNVNLDFKKLKNLKCDIYLRSIFLQGVYFANLRYKFSKPIVNKINLQKEYLLSRALNYNFDIGQYLFSNALSFCQENQFKGVVIGSSSFERVRNYVINHKFVEINDKNSLKRFDIIDDYLADPRKWKI